MKEILKEIILFRDKMKLPKFCFLEVNPTLYNYIMLSDFYDRKTKTYKVALYSFEVILNTEIPYWFSMVEKNV